MRLEPEPDRRAAVEPWWAMPSRADAWIVYARKRGILELSTIGWFITVVTMGLVAVAFTVDVDALQLASMLFAGSVYGYATALRSAPERDEDRRSAFYSAPARLGSGLALALMGFLFGIGLAFDALP